MQEIPLHPVAFWACDLCITGAGGECHVPGCMYWCKDAPRSVDLEWLRMHTLPAADAPAPPQGVDVIAAARQFLDADSLEPVSPASQARRAALRAIVDAVPAGPQPSDETEGEER